MDNNELYHWGILGMKWGVRRYQNKDGSLTPAGKKRREKAQEIIDRLDNPNTSRKYTKGKKTETTKEKTVKEMTNEELATLLYRTRMQKDILDLNKQLSNLETKKVSKGKQFVSDVMSKAVEPAIIEAGKNTLTKFLTKTASKALKLDSSNDSFADLKKEVANLSLQKQKLELDKYFKENK